MSLDTIDRQDCATYRVRRGHRYYGVDIIAYAESCAVQETGLRGLGSNEKGSIMRLMLIS